MIVIPPEPIELEKSDGTTITIPPPDVHIGLQPLSVRLLSKEKRQGMVKIFFITCKLKKFFFTKPFTYS